MIETVAAWRLEPGDRVGDRVVFRVSDIAPANVIVSWTDGTRTGHRYDEQVEREPCCGSSPA